MVEKKKIKFIFVSCLFETQKNNELLMQDDKLRLVDYDHFFQENLTFYIKKKNQHWSRKWT